MLHRLGNCHWIRKVGDMSLIGYTHANSSLVIAQLRETNKFEDMSLGTDEDEHSIEMHLPYIRKIFQSADIKIVPILVGSLSLESEKAYGKLLAPYLQSKDTFCVVSSDFCHWWVITRSYGRVLTSRRGTRFQYTHYYPSPSTVSGIKLDRSTSTTTYATYPIHESIRRLDNEAMAVLEEPSATNAHTAFAKYLKETGNTICGRHPIGVLLGATSAMEEQGIKAQLKWVRYEQSSQCLHLRDSSVSYASAWITF